MKADEMVRSAIGQSIDWSDVKPEDAESMSTLRNRLLLHVNACGHSMDNPPPLDIQPACHGEAGLKVILSLAGVMVVKCHECGAPVVAVRIAE